MGGAVSSGKDNDSLVNNLVKCGYIKTAPVERVFRAVDRGLYYVPRGRYTAYRDVAWRHENLHISAPCIYAEVMETLELKAGHSFLNLGSGTGYLSTIVGLMIGSSGVNHGVEIHKDVVQYALDKLELFKQSAAIDIFDFCQPVFIQGNILNISSSQRYDRIYVGASCTPEMQDKIKILLKVGGVLVSPCRDHITKIIRSSETEWQQEDLFPVSFASLILPTADDTGTVTLPPFVSKSLLELSRGCIRRCIRSAIEKDEPDVMKDVIKTLCPKVQTKKNTNRRPSKLFFINPNRLGHGVRELESYLLETYFGRAESVDVEDDDDDEVESDDNSMVETTTLELIGRTPVPHASGSKNFEEGACASGSKNYREETCSLGSKNIGACASGSKNCKEELHASGSKSCEVEARASGSKNSKNPKQETHSSGRKNPEEGPHASGSKNYKEEIRTSGSKNIEEGVRASNRKNYKEGNSLSGSKSCEEEACASSTENHEKDSKVKPKNVGWASNSSKTDKNGVSSSMQDKRKRGSLPSVSVDENEDKSTSMGGKLELSASIQKVSKRQKVNDVQRRIVDDINEFHRLRQRASVEESSESDSEDSLSSDSLSSEVESLTERTAGEPFWSDFIAAEGEDLIDDFTSFPENMGPNPSFRTLMERKIQRLELPFSLKLYLNYGREFKPAA